MGKIVITHVGTSALDCEALNASLLPYPYKLDQIKKNARLRDEERTDFEECLYKGLCDIWKEPETEYTEEEKRKASPAEIASLNMLGLNAGDRVVLVSSDTNAGKFCAALLRYCLTSPTDGTPDEGYVFRPTGLDVPEYSVLEGVKMDNDNQFVEKGLPTYMELVGNEYNAMNKQHKLIFNITGGYKGIIPFAVLAAQLLGAHTERGIKADVVYMHETSTNLITLGPQLPFDWREMTNLYPGIHTLVEYPNTPAAHALDERWNVYRLQGRDEANELAKAVYHLLRTLNNWL